MVRRCPGWENGTDSSKLCRIFELIVTTLIITTSPKLSVKSCQQHPIEQFKSDIVFSFDGEVNIQFAFIRIMNDDTCISILLQW